MPIASSQPIPMPRRAPAMWGRCKILIAPHLKQAHKVPRSRLGLKLALRNDQEVWGATPSGDFARNSDLILQLPHCGPRKDEEYMHIEF